MELDFYSNICVEKVTEGDKLTEERAVTLNCSLEQYYECPRFLSIAHADSPPAGFRDVKSMAGGIFALEQGH
jgi:hypothetical protein